MRFRLVHIHRLKKPLSEVALPRRYDYLGQKVSCAVGNRNRVPAGGVCGLSVVVNDRYHALLV
jgi:hypothetical protein